MNTISASAAATQPDAAAHFFAQGDVSRALRYRHDAIMVTTAARHRRRSYGISPAAEISAALLYFARR